MIIRNEYKGDLAIGSRIKSTTVSTLDAVTETAQVIADTVTTVRSAVELMHGALQPAIMEQRIELANTAQKGIKQLMANGMTEEQACNYLQVAYIPKANKSAIVNANQ